MQTHVFTRFLKTGTHGRTQNNFLRRERHFLGRLNDFIFEKICFKWVILYTLFHKCRIPGPDNYLVLLIVVNAHAGLTILWKTKICDKNMLMCKKLIMSLSLLLRTNIFVIYGQAYIFSSLWLKIYRFSSLFLSNHECTTNLPNHEQ